MDSRDREQGLADKFEDPSLDEIVPGISTGDPSYGASVVQEAADAVQELVTEIHTDSAFQSGPDAEVFQVSTENEAPAFDISHVVDDPQMEIQKDLFVNPETYRIEEEMPETTLMTVRWQMAQQMFDLVACEVSFVKLVEGILASVVQGLNAQAGSVLELDTQKKEYFFRASIGGGDPDRLKAFRVPANKGIVGHVAETREALILKDMGEDQKQLKAISMSVGFETNTCLAAPIIIANNIYGVLELFNKNGGGAFTASDARLLEDGIKMATKALEVRFLMAEIHRRAKK